MNNPVTFPVALCPFFATRSFQGEFAMRGGAYEIDVQTPDMTTSAPSVWGDWGPMYTASLAVDQRVTITYRCPLLGRSATYQFSPPTIAVNSPARAAERAKWPLAMIIVDAARGLRITAFMDADGVVGKVEAQSVHCSVDPSALLFREADVAAQQQAASHWRD
ncbi:MAG: hypothetical protein ACI9U2_003424 [Bradymonadia bacterium]|jgi:hypothetical protein